MATHTHSADGPTDCFGCKVRSINTWLGSVQGRPQGAEGRKKFHGQTNKERLEREFKLAGGKDKVEPMGSRWV